MSGTWQGAVGGAGQGAVSGTGQGAVGGTGQGAVGGTGQGAVSGAAAPGRRWVTRGAAETERLGGELAAELAPDGVLLLSGELGSGKTVVARGVAGALGIDPRQVLSPTFNLIREHRGGAGGALRMVHVDLYRLAPEETVGLGLEELLAGPGVKVVEWAERLPAALAAAAPPTLALRLRRLPEDGDEAREIVEMAPSVIGAQLQRRGSWEGGRGGGA